MKARIKITVMLMAMIIGTLAASAQSASRRTPQDSRKASSVSKQRPSSTQGDTKSVSSRTRNTKPTNIASSKTPSPVSRVSANKVSQKREATQRPSSRSSASNSYSRGSYTKPNSRVSTTNSHNPKSTYRVAERTFDVRKTYKDPRTGSTAYKRERSSQGKVVHHHKQYVNRYGHIHYPRKKVTIHVHPITVKHHYRVLYYPAHREIVWNRRMHRYYVDLYPGISWRYYYGYRIQTLSAFEARYNVGEIGRVYGRVYATWYNRESDDLLLFFGGEYPSQEFTMIVPGNIARRHSWRPSKYFLGKHVMSTGLITNYNGKPEMIIKKYSQFELF